jgi:phage terminase Nu1 subunit (DNA packaging protein)
MTARQRAKPKARAKRQPKAKPRARKAGCSLRAFARHIGKSHTAVEKAIASGRLSESIGHDAKGAPRILDLQRAVREWKERGFSLSDAQRRATLERARGYRLKNLATQGKLYDRSAAKREAFECARTVRDSMLNIPDRVAAQLAAETDPARVFAILEGEIRKALVALAEDLADDQPVADAAAAPADELARAV